MQRLLSSLLLIFIMVAPHHTYADGLLYQLPKDGAYVVYEMEMKTVVNNPIWSLKMSSVGVATVNGKKCRWIEFKLSKGQDGSGKTSITKILIPERNLRAGENAFGSKIRGWVRKSSDAEVKVVDETNSGLLTTFLCGSLNEEKKLKPVVVDSKIGKLECAGVSGYKEFKDAGHKAKAMFKIRRHKRAPFGVVSAEIAMETYINEKITIKDKFTLTIKEVGKNAKSELPDAK